MRIDPVLILNSHFCPVCHGENPDFGDMCKQCKEEFWATTQA